MLQKNDDIELMLDEVKRAESVAADAELDINARDDLLRGFTTRCAGSLISLLKELETLRNYVQSDAGRITLKTHRVLVEGFSDRTSSDALSQALEKAKFYFTENHDVSLNLQGLTALPDGGHRATLEILLTPFSRRPRTQVQSLEAEARQFRARNFKALRTREANEAKHLIYDHFAAINGATLAMPEYMMINVNDASVMNMMLEQRFFKAGKGEASNDSEPPPASEKLPTSFAVRFAQEPGAH